MLNIDTEVSPVKYRFKIVVLISLVLVNHLMLILNLDLLIRTLFIYFDNMSVPKFHQLVSHILGVSLLRLLLDLMTNLWVLRKQVVQ